MRESGNSSSKDAREQRRAEALRRNLQRRKEQARGRTERGGDADAPPRAPEKSA